MKTKQKRPTVTMEHY